MKKIIIILCAAVVVAAGFFVLKQTGVISIDRGGKVELGEYTGLDIEYDYQALTDADIEQAVLQHYRNNAPRPPVANGDTVYIDYSGSIDGIPFEHGTAEDAQLVIGSGQFIPGFEEQLIGMNTGDTKDINVTFPDPYPNNPDMSGAKAVFAIKLNYIESASLMEINYADITDDMVKEAFKDQDEKYETVAEYFEYAKTEMQKMTDDQNEDGKQNVLIDAIMENSEVIRIDKKKFNTYYNYNVERLTQMATENSTDIDSFIMQNVGRSADEFFEERKEQIEEQMKVLIVIKTIADKEGISVTDEDYREYLEEYGMEDDEEVKVFIYDEILINRTIEFLMLSNNFIPRPVDL